MLCGMAGTVMVPVILRISLQPALQGPIRAVRCQRRMTAPGRDQLAGDRPVTMS